MRRTEIEALEWSAAEVGPLVHAGRRAPVYGGGHPWVLEPHGRGVSLYELPHHSFRDRLGIGRLLTCGAVLHNVHTALRAAGWQVEVEMPGDVAKPDLLAVLTAVRRLAPTSWEVLDHQAIDEEGAPRPAELSDLVAANHWAGTRVRLADPAVSTSPATPVVLLVSTDGDSRRDVLCAGAALQAVRLRARALGIQTTAVHPWPHEVPGHVWASIEVSGLSGPHPEG